MARRSPEEILAQKQKELDDYIQKMRQREQAAAEKKRDSQKAKLTSLYKRRDRQTESLSNIESALAETVDKIAELEKELGVEPDSE